jgi:RimJ/RimL family protein N-acetyltransferase
MITPHELRSGPTNVASASVYPASLTREVRQIEGALHCRSGNTLYVRAIHSYDAPRLQAFHGGLSIDSIVFRFFRYLPMLSDADAQRFTQVDYQERMALVVVELANGVTEPDASSPIVGVVRYDQVSASLAEVAFVVADRWQGQGIATALLHRLAAYARRCGISTFMAITMGANIRMLDVLRHAGYPIALRHDNGDIEIKLDITHPAPGEPTIRFSEVVH